MFNQMVEVLSHWSNYSLNSKVSRGDYDKFCRDWIWMTLQGKRFGTEFSRRFSIYDQYLNVITNTQQCRRHIELFYLENEG